MSGKVGTNLMSYRQQPINYSLSIQKMDQILTIVCET